jgi:hypothetical protein
VEFLKSERSTRTLSVLDLVSQVRDVVLMNVYLDLGDPGAQGTLCVTRLSAVALNVSGKHATFN